jgi:hypothetical protein
MLKKLKREENDIYANNSFKYKRIQNYNEDKNIIINTKNQITRFFIIKSINEENIHKSI